MDLNHTRLPVPPPEHFIFASAITRIRDHALNISPDFCFFKWNFGKF